MARKVNQYFQLVALGARCLIAQQRTTGFNNVAQKSRKAIDGAYYTRRRTNCHF
jgi:hypothetical protein